MIKLFLLVLVLVLGKAVLFPSRAKAGINVVENDIDWEGIPPH